MRGVVLLVLALSATTRADASEHPRAVTLADVVEATAHAPAAQISRNEIAAAAALVDAAGAWPDPSIRVETNRLTAHLVAGAMLPLPLFGTVGAAQRVAAAQAEVVRDEAVVRDLDVARMAVTAWIALARADGEASAAAIVATQAAELERIARGRVDIGTGAEVDVSAAVAARARATLAVSTARRAQEARAAELAGVLGWDPQQPLVSAGEFPGREVGSIEALRGRLAMHPERAAAVHRIAVAEATVAEARAARWPRLAVEGQVSVDDPTQPGTDVFVALSLELPVFAHTGDRARSARATAAAERARLATTEARLGASVVAALRRWQAARETITALEQTIVPAQERASALSAQAYREGARDLGSALQADRDLAAVRAELVAARADAATAWVDVVQASGRSFEVSRAH